VRVDYVRRTCQREQLADTPTVFLGKCLDADARQNPGKISLPAPVSPDLAHYRGAYPDWRSLLLEHP
jgi:hypothetical protein